MEGWGWAIEGIQEIVVPRQVHCKLKRLRLSYDILYTMDHRPTSPLLLAWKGNHGSGAQLASATWEAGNKHQVGHSAKDENRRQSRQEVSEAQESETCQTSSKPSGISNVRRLGAWMPRCGW